MFHLVHSTKGAFTELSYNFPNIFWVCVCLYMLQHLLALLGFRLEEALEHGAGKVSDAAKQLDETGRLHSTTECDGSSKRKRSVTETLLAPHQHAKTLAILVSYMHIT
eukprot:m.32497 g.32497  ORF g.32497 m.32497 type:complete len:108 (-) comp9526_c0_seq2:64-387(-)